MAPAPPTRRRSDHPRADSQQETGNPGRSNQRREGGQAPLRPEYRHRCCPNARRDARMQEHKRRATKTDQDTRPKHRPNRDPTPGTKHRPQPSANGDERKNTVAGAGPWGRCRGRCTDRGRRSWPGLRDTRGNPNPKWVWVSPAPERERKRENVVGDHAKQTKKERGQTNIWANKGQVLKGTKPNMIPTPETKNAIPTNRTNNPKALNKKPITSQTKSRRNYHSRVAGPMGRPALSEETPRGTVVQRGPRTPPPREAPPVAQELASCRTINSFPRKLGPTLSRSEET